MDPKKPAVLVDNKATQLAEEVRKILPLTTRARIATGYFYANGFQLLADKAQHLTQAESIQVILGLETDHATKTVVETALKDKKAEILRNVREELFKLEDSPANADYLQQLYDAIHSGAMHFRAFREGIFHPKAYIFATDSGTDYAYVGSSNFTRPGMSTNLELNILTKDELTIKALSDWFDALFSDDKITEELREGLLEAVRRSPIRKRREHPEFVTPWEMLLCVAAEFIRQSQTTKRSDFLAEFQQTGVFAATKRLEDYGGCIIADSVGLGKSFIGAAIMDNFHRDKKTNGEPYRVLALVPAHLKDQWTYLLQEDGPASTPGEKYFGLQVDGKSVAVASQGVFANLEEDTVVKEFGDFDLVVVDEAHRFRNDAATVKRVRLLEALKNNPKRKEADAVKFVFLTATPLNNSVRDLKNLISLCTIRKRLENRAGMKLDAFDIFLQYFNREHNQEPGAPPVVLTDPERKQKERAKQTIDRILKEVMILRTREFLQKRPGGIQVGGRQIQFSRPNVRAESYQQTNAKFEALVANIPDFLTGLNAPHITIVNPNAGFALAGLFKIHLLKRLESSPYAFWRSLQNFSASLTELEIALTSPRSFEEIVQEYKRRRGDEIPEESYGDDRDEAPEAEATIDGDAAKKDFLAQVHADRQHLSDLLKEYFDGAGGLRHPSGGEYAFDDNKVAHLVQQLTKSNPKKVLIFTQYADTANYLLHHLRQRLKGEAGAQGYRVGMATGNGSDHPFLGQAPSRRDMVWYFSPTSNERLNENGEAASPEENELDILIATDSLSEGVNLQECRFLVNYDLPWNPTRIVQRVGRIDRIVRTGQPGQNEIMNLVSPDTVEAQLGLIDTLRKKSEQIALFVAKEYGIISGAEATAYKTYGHDMSASEMALIRDRISRLQRASADELERLGRNPLLEGAIQEDDSALWRLSLKALLDEHGATPAQIQAARAKFPEDPPRFAYFRGPDPGIFLYAQVVDHRRGNRVREDISLWYSLRAGEVVHVDPGDLGVAPTTPGYAPVEVNAEDYEAAIAKLEAEAEAILQRHKDEAAGLYDTIEKSYPAFQNKLIPHLRKFLAMDSQARKGAGITDTSPIPDDIREKFRETANWLKKNVLTNSDDRELKDLLGADWAKMNAPQLHKLLHSFHLAKQKQRQDYRIGTVVPEDLRLRIICGGVSIAQAHQE